MRLRLYFEPKPNHSVETDKEFLDNHFSQLKSLLGNMISYAGYISFDLNKSKYQTLGPYYQALANDLNEIDAAAILKVINTQPLTFYHIHVQLEHQGENVMLDEDLLSVLPRYRSITS